MRRRPRNRQFVRQAIDADIEEAADGEPEYGDEEQQRNVGDHRTSGGSGRSGERSSRSTDPVAASYRYGAPAGSRGTPRNTPAATRSRHEPERLPVCRSWLAIAPLSVSI